MQRALSGILFVAFITPLATTANAQTVTETVGSVADTFVRGEDAFATFGSAGAMHVSGDASVNALGAPQGVAEAWLRFDMAPAVARFDSAFGIARWELVSATLRIDGVGAPTHPMFNRGAGLVQVLWVANDTWTEGTGKPIAPGTVVGSNLSYHAAQSRLDPAVDEFVASFDHSAESGVVDLPLQLTAGFAADLEGAGEATIVLTTNDPGVGLTFHSRSWSGVAGRPTLKLVAQPAPIPDPEPDAGANDPVTPAPQDEPADPPDADVPADEDPVSVDNDASDAPTQGTDDGPGKEDPLEEEEDEILGIADDAPQDDADAGSESDDTVVPGGGGDSIVEVVLTEDEPDACGAGLLGPAVLMFAAFLTTSRLLRGAK